MDTNFSKKSDILKAKKSTSKNHTIYTHLSISSKGHVYSSIFSKNHMHSIIFPRIICTHVSFERILLTQFSFEMMICTHSTFQRIVCTRNPAGCDWHHWQRLPVGEVGTLDHCGVGVQCSSDNIL